MVKDISALNSADKLTLCDAIGMVTLASSTLSAPVEFIDLSLPAGYSGFELTAFGLTNDAADYPGFLFSADNGATWISDPDDDLLYQFNDIPGNGTSLAFGRFGDDNSEGNQANSWVSSIWPGVTGKTANVTTVISQPASLGGIRSSVVASGLATTTGRMNKIRLLTAKQVYVPGESHAWQSGSYILRGLPSGT